MKGLDALAGATAVGWNGATPAGGAAMKGLDALAGATAVGWNGATSAGGADVSKAPWKGSWYLMVVADAGGVVGGEGGVVTAGALGRLNADDVKFFACFASELTELFLASAGFDAGAGGGAHCCGGCDGCC